ncbi:MAG TPA: helix-turn-helix domain-containing protein [Bryobacteraceae bacterium]|nr:helix-turn-helix domain-containing protein [Bryobacteraceae bacterium]
MQAVSRAFFAIDKTRQVGRMTVALLAQAPGWDKSSASRYLKFLANQGWLENVKDGPVPVYVLGQKLLDMVPDLKF